MKIIYGNVRSINKNFFNLLANVNVQYYDLIALSETWLSDNVPCPYLNNFCFISAGSCYGKSGGVVMYFKNSLRVKSIMLDDIPLVNSFTEFLAVEIVEIKIIILLIYRHPTGNLNDFLNALDYIFSSNTFNKSDYSVFVMGDVNINILKDSKICKDYLNLYISHSYNCFNEKPTRSVNGSDS